MKHYEDGREDFALKTRTQGCSLRFSAKTKAVNMRCNGDAKVPYNDRKDNSELKFRSEVALHGLTKMVKDLTIDFQDEIEEDNDQLAMMSGNLAQITHIKKKEKDAGNSGY